MRDGPHDPSSSSNELGARTCLVCLILLRSAPLSLRVEEIILMPWNGSWTASAVDLKSLTRGQLSPSPYQPRLKGTSRPTFPCTKWGRTIISNSAHQMRHESHHLLRLHIASSDDSRTGKPWCSTPFAIQAVPRPTLYTYPDVPPT